MEELREKLETAAQMPKRLTGISYEIWQLRDAPENDILRFASYDTAIKFRLTESRYDKVYEAQAGEDDDILIITNHGYTRTHKEGTAYYKTEPFKGKYKKHRSESKCYDGSVGFTLTMLRRSPITG